MLQKTLMYGLLSVLLSLGVSCQSSNGSTTNLVDSNKEKQFDELINRYVENGKFNGSVLVAKQGDLVYKKGFGYANMEWEIPNQSDTKFRLASVSKQFTALLILQLVEQNKVDLHVPISTYLSDYPKEKGDLISIHQLLIHTSGVPELDFDRTKKHSPKELMQTFAHADLLFTPGERYDYSNSGYILLGLIIEQATGKTYEEILQEYILEPLQMNNTGYDHHNVLLRNKASGYKKALGGYQYANFIHMSVPYSAGGLYSTAEDLFKWDRALYSDQLLPKVYMNLLFDGYIKEGVRSYYGYGWSIGEIFIGNTTESVKAIHHDGVINGFTSFIVRMPETESLVVLLNNTGRAPLHQMVKDITGILFDVSYDVPKKSLTNAVADYIDQNGISKGKLFFNEAKDSDEYYLSENEMNILGYSLLVSDRLNDAVGIFHLNVEAFPKSFNVYDSYGEALMKLGYKESAIKNYEKSLELNPNNENAKKMLSRLIDKC